MGAFRSLARPFEALVITTLTLACLTANTEYMAAQEINKVDQPAPGNSFQNHSQGNSLNDVSSLELTRAARPWEFADAVGTRSALLGNESANFEAWVYPLKILRNFHLRFKVDKETFEAKALVRSIRVRPESTAITYAWDTFQVTETFFAPVHEPGAIITIEIDTAQPMEIEAVFDRDFQLEWPGVIGGSDIEWVAALHAFSFEDGQHKFTALVGSPSATDFHLEFSTNYTTAKENSLSLGKVSPGRSTQVIAIAASFQGLPPVDVTYRTLCNSYPQLLADSAAYYANYLKDRVRLELPDSALQQAYEWAQISVLQSLVTNPFLGTGLVAGYDVSGDDGRPGYDWFFGRDALWTSLALNAEGDFMTTRTALQFLAKYQRRDGKITHEIAQGASFVPWFEAMPFAYAAADATPLYIVAMDDYVRRSGDTAFAQEEWDNLWRAYQFLVSTYDKSGFPKNDGVGHGWVEGGPLLPVKSELYQASVALESLRSLADLAHVLGKKEQQTKLESEFDSGKAALNMAFWIAEQNRYAFALDGKDAQVDTPSILSTVPMWFGLLDTDKTRAMLGLLTGPETQTDWGTRIIPASHSKYDPAGYHSGTVWPLFTGWASVGEYKYHDALPAYANLQANALLTFDGSLGHVAEVLSGNYYQTLASASPHQIWSSAMVISPLLTGLLGLDADALAHRVSFQPHIPTDWTWFAVQHVKAGPCQLNLRYDKTLDAMTFEIERTDGTGCSIDLSPALSLRAQILGVEFNGHKTPFHLQTNTLDQHVGIHLDLSDKSNGPSFLVIRLKNDFGLSQHVVLPSLGSASQGLRIVSETWNAHRDTLILDTASASSGTYELSIWNPAEITGVEGAELVRKDTQSASLRITLDPGEHGTYSHRTVLIHFDNTTRHKQAENDSRSARKGTSNAN
jgi:glycogen debranching enzyme